MWTHLCAFFRAFLPSRDEINADSLAAIYQNMTDAQLLGIAPQHLTADARPLWQAEMARRNLQSPHT